MQRVMGHQARKVVGSEVVDQGRQTLLPKSWEGPLILGPKRFFDRLEEPRRGVGQGGQWRGGRGGGGEVGRTNGSLGNGEWGNPAVEKVAGQLAGRVLLSVTEVASTGTVTGAGRACEWVGRRVAGCGMGWKGSRERGVACVVWVS